jgi:hypothetical protein
MFLKTDVPLHSRHATLQAAHLFTQVLPKMAQCILNRLPVLKQTYLSTDDMAPFGRCSYSCNMCPFLKVVDSLVVQPSQAGTSVLSIEHRKYLQIQQTGPNGVVQKLSTKQCGSVNFSLQTYFQALDNFLR